MNYFVTGLTGFIGNQLLQNLCRREGTIYALVRPGSEGKIKDLRHKLNIPDQKLVIVEGNLSEPLCGVEPHVLAQIRGGVDGFYHLGAIYSLTADADSQRAANVNGTREAIRLAEALDARCFHHVSSIVAAGFYQGTFTEDMFDEAVDVERNAYFHTKHLAEGLVRHKCHIPWRIYRPGAVVGHSVSGWINKVDGPYYFFPLLDKISEVLPRWFPLPKYQGNQLNIVPVDFVADALDHISHQPDLDGKCFHLTDPDPLLLGDLLNEFLKAAKGPLMKLDLPLDRAMDFLPAGARSLAGNRKVFERVKEQVAENLNIPKEVLLTESLNTQYDCSNTLQALEGSGIEVPALKTYAARLWHYWDQHLHPDHNLPRSIEDAVAGRTVLITGGSEGIGKQVGVDCAVAGARVILVARTQSKLDAAVEEIRAAGGDAHSYSCDLSDLEACDRMIDQVLSDHGHVDVLVNNAGRSIRRSLSLTYERFHDFERVMQINYFSAIRLAMRLLPSMAEREQGHIVNVSSIAALTRGTPRFSSYVASKSALDAWSDSAGVEYRHKNIAFTNIHMPLVRTGMIEATTSYRNVQTLTPEQASELVCEAMVDRPMEVNTLTGNITRLLGTLAPELHKLVFATVYQLTDDSAAAKDSAKHSSTADLSSVAQQAVDALSSLDLDAETLEGISELLKGHHT
ncbi:SDR family oxidoreductase [Pseudomaricurvus alkylphenolicus]|jgi:NAD(P)-dependent dehydrogenase (short-subunit alcohol dehydrogenase family)|uniref:SDR family oxidoreductase n=1 Tax=Pseudomaricurvus alkylphenolicus TaxID=1306991 RepID=UPI0014203C9C|nr:SDR family oxidoreductase [Pseudomaricurvus alkylphenolicus]NIB40627.1 SDR family oxidoreductase [Pseudomaricurvus alkylphenolicus]